jgi:hypothetical protein
MVNTNRLRKIKQFEESDTYIQGQRTGSTAGKGDRFGLGGHLVFRDGSRPCEPESFSRPCALPLNEIVPVHIVQIEIVHVLVIIRRCHDGWVEVNASIQSGIELIVSQPIHRHGSRLHPVGKFENLI